MKKRIKKLDKDKIPLILIEIMRICINEGKNNKAKEDNEKNYVNNEEDEEYNA